MRRIIYTPPARQDFRDILRYVTRESSSLKVGTSFVARLRTQCSKIASLPGMLGTARPEICEGVRSIPHNGYIIFFRYLDGVVEIINILHDHRDVLQYFDNE